MKLEIAKPEDSKALVDFFKTFPLPGLVEVKVDRNNNFFSPYEIQSDKHLTYQLKEEDKIEGTASFVLKNVLLENKISPVAFGRDLRISPHRRAILEWSQHFLPVMEDVSKSFASEYMFSVLSLNEVQALNAFVRPKNRKRPLPRYYLYRRFNAVTVHGRLPWARLPLPHFRFQKGNLGNIDALTQYIIKKSKHRDLSTVWDEQSFYQKLSRWKGLRLEDFIIAFDKNENIVGCVAPWSSEGIQDLIPLSYSLRAQNFRQFLKFGQKLGWTRTLTKPMPHADQGERFKFKYLNFLYAENGDIFESLLWRAFDEANEDEFLLYNQVRSEFIYRRPNTWITTKIPYAVYLLSAPDQPIPDFLNPRNERPIEIEPFFSI